MSIEEPGWLPLAREMHAIAQAGITYAKDPFDRDRYERLRRLADDAFALHTHATPETIAGLFATKAGYPTPRVGVRSATFDARGRLLLVREVADGGRWTLPGGWAEVNLTPAENVVKETREESGYDVIVTKLAAAWDRTRQKHPVGLFSCYELFFICELAGGHAATSAETCEVGWFAEHEIPDNLSLGRVLPRQIERMFTHHRFPLTSTESIELDSDDPDSDVRAAFEATQLRTSVNPTFELESL